MRSPAKAEAFVQLTLRFKKEGATWNAFCEELGTATFARTLEAAKERIMEAVCLHLNTLEEVGERARFFKDHGIKLYSTKPTMLSIPSDPSYYSSAFVIPVEESRVHC